jgi:hypothetical protein
MSSSAGVDTLLDRLLATTEALRDSARVFAVSQASDLLAQRQDLASTLQSALQSASLTEDQRRKLERATELGAQARQALLIKRETTRRELQQQIAGRHFNERFKPYRPKKLGSLNIKL